MLRPIVLYILLFSLPQIGFGQYFEFPFGDVQQMVCPFDSTDTIHMSTNYHFYSTQDDNYYGSIDSTLCYTIDTTTGLFNTYQVPEGRKLFAEFILQDSLPLWPHRAYSISNLFENAACDSIGCKKIIIETWIPDTSGTQFVAHPRILNFEDSPFVGDEACLASEKFDQQHIRRVIFEYLPSDSSSIWLNPYANLQETWNIWQVPPTFSWLNLSWEVALVTQFDTIYPTDSTVAYSEFVPWSNPTDSQHLDIFIDEYSALVFEPHTGIRGALVEGSDSVRHSISIHDNGMVCLTFVEVFWEGNNSIVFEGGSLDMQHELSCFVVGNGGTMQVSSGTQLDYGKFGRGMLILKPDANIVIEPGAELRIGCNVHMYEYAHNTDEDEIVIDLVKGAKLTFTPSATLSNEFSRNKDLKLKVRMMGGILDDSGLSANEKRLIERIYERPEKRFQDNLGIYPNPVLDNLEFYWISSKAGKALTFEILEIGGKLMATQSTETPFEGRVFYEMPVDNLDPGMYLLRLSENGAAVTTPFIKL